MTIKNESRANPASKPINKDYNTIIRANKPAMVCFNRLVNKSASMSRSIGQKACLVNFYGSEGC